MTRIPPYRLRHAAMLPLLLACLLLAPCTGQTAQAQPMPAPEDSRAGDVKPVRDYEEALSIILEKTVTDAGTVRYDLLRGDLSLMFRRVLKAIEDFDVTTLRTPAQQMAFWMNAYNVQMLQNIVETPTVNNIIDDGYGDAFFETPFRTAGTPMTLNEIENVILRREAGRDVLLPFQIERLDPRLHVGLNCAARSCPRLRQEAFTAAAIDAQLNAAMRDFANGPAHFRVEGDRVVLSSLLDWYGPDFDGLGEPAGDFILRYMNPSRPGYDRLKKTLAGQTSAALKALPNVQFEYLWTVNRAG